MTDSIDTSEREAEEPRAGRSNARPSNRDAFLPVVVEDLTGVSEEGRQIIYALERARDENHAHAMRLLGARDYGAEFPAADAECIDKAIGLIVGYSRLERVNAELVEAAQPAQGEAALSTSDVSALSVCRLFIDTIHSVENRCMAADGPVTKTCDEITDDELRAVYDAAKAVVRASKEQIK